MIDQHVAYYRQKKTTPDGVVSFHDILRSSIDSGFEWSRVNFRSQPINFNWQVDLRGETISYYFILLCQMVQKKTPQSLERGVFIGKEGLEPSTPGL
jgi:hypothetical protein